MNDTKNDGPGRLLSDAILISLLTGTTYVAVYAYDYGYATVFGIAPEWISVSVTNLIAAGLVGFSVVAYVGIGLVSSDKLPNLGERGIFAVMSSCLGFEMAMVFGSHPCVPPLLRWGIAAIGLVLATSGVYSLIARKAHLDPHQTTLRLSGLIAIMPTPWARVVLFTPLIAFILVLGAFGAGELRALLRDEFPVIPDATATVILATFGDEVVTAPYDPGTNKVNRDFKLIPLKEIRRVQIRRTGRLICDCGSGMSP